MTDGISFGGGVNSVAMTIMLVAEGWRGPIVFADTGAEWPETYCYLDYFESEFLEGRDLTITRLKPPSQYHRKDVRGSLEERCLEQAVIPLAFLRWCTNRYKTEPLKKWARLNGISIMWIAISAEESHRAKPRDGIAYPLTERGIDRERCKEIIRDAGLEVPIKSGCFFCPFAGKSRLRELYETHPDLFERAALMERKATARRGVRATLDPGGRYTLDELRESFQRQIELPGFGYEYLREFQPCICGL